MFSCFHWITGGRVGEIVNQESRWCGGNSGEHDKFEKFCEKYEGFIDVVKSYSTFCDNWEREKKEASSPRVLRALTKSFYGDLFKAFVSKLVWSILVIFSIWYFVFEILDFIKAKSNGIKASVNKEFYLCAGFMACMFFLSVGIQQMGMYSSYLGAKVKAALTTAIYKKIITREGYASDANVVSLVAKDVEKLAEACLSLQYLWSGIFETLAVLAVTFTLLGATILPGIGLMFVFMPLQYCLGVVVAYRKKTLAKVSSKRISLTEEILRGIKLIKIYGWEASFSKNVEALRDEETILLDRINRIKAAILGFIFCLPPLMSLVIFGTQEATGTIESVVVFTALSFFNTLRVPFSKLPKSLRDVLDAFSCLERIQNFLLEPDLSNADTVDAVSSNPGIVFRNVSLSYGRGAKKVLNGINLNIPAGSLMMVAGPVASGKSNLLKSILGDLTICEGTCSVSASKAYVPQTPWTALGTVRENILFGKPYDEAYYHKVIHACALETDLKIMENGDQTWIGERGGNLSGGQKQRIALARAAYSRADLYVLDSPLSAVDMYTCQHIFKYCIRDLMIAGGGTVVLATHQTELFSMSDHLVVMQEGKMAYNDKYSYNGIKHLFPNFSGDGDDSGEIEQKRKPSKATQESDKRKKDTDTETPAVKPQVTVANESDENVYIWYIKKLGVCMFMTAILIFIVGQIMRVYSDVWISVWSKRTYDKQGFPFNTDEFYALMYTMLVLVFLAFAFLRAYFYFFVGSIGSKRIHDGSMKCALEAPMHFFHVTPIGKLLAYFSQDMETIDDMLVDNMLMFQIFAWVLILALSVVAYNLPMFLAIVAGLTVMYLYIVFIFIRTSVPLKKAAGQAASHVVAHTAETLSGLSVVRAFRMQERFVNENLQFQSKSTVVTFSLANLSLWLAFRVDIIGALLVLTCCLLAVLDSSMDAAIAGLIVSNSFQILLFFSIMSRTMGEVHDNMNAIDKAKVMTNLEAEREPEPEHELKEIPAKWPSKGEIAFEGVVMPYLPNHPPVLRGITFSIREGEKVGVVGRTGAGKSSLIVALYRLAEISSGKIHVDSIDCSRVSLNKLRSSMAIIPQEPVMFGGTLRTNLDPFNEHQDRELLDVLHKCLLAPMLKANPDGLNTKVEPMGTNFSLGTQQLICLARAMLNPSRVLLLDEATAALDSDTNAAVQQVLKDHFYDRTIFTIAHRLDTIIESDRILVMNAGVVSEYDPPHVLLENPDSLFYELCMNTGKAQFEVLKGKAKAKANINDSEFLS
jgi:ABC-type multidrug transport system fused ATPase/permease subunit